MATEAGVFIIPSAARDEGHRSAVSVRASVCAWRGSTARGASLGLPLPLTKPAGWALLTACAPRKVQCTLGEGRRAAGLRSADSSPRVSWAVRPRGEQHQRGAALGGAGPAPTNTSGSPGGSCTVTTKYTPDGKCGVIYFCYCWSDVLPALPSPGGWLSTHQALSEKRHKANIGRA